MSDCLFYSGIEPVLQRLMRIEFYNFARGDRAFLSATGIVPTASLMQLDPELSEFWQGDTVTCNKGISNAFQQCATTGHDLLQCHLRQTLVGADDQFSACHI